MADTEGLLVHFRSWELNPPLPYWCVNLSRLQDIKDDYIFECEVSGQTQKTKVTIFQSVGDPMFHGKIYSAKDSKCEEEGPDLHLIHPP